jgi:hypothetical protein
MTQNLERGYINSEGIINFQGTELIFTERGDKNAYFTDMSRGASVCMVSMSYG